MRRRTTSVRCSRKARIAASSGELLGLTVVDGQEDHGEGLLHGGVLVELVEDDLVLGSTLEADDDAHAVAVGLVAELVASDVGDDALVDELGDALDEAGFVDLVRDLGDDDGFTGRRRFFRCCTWRAS